MSQNAVLRAFHIDADKSFVRPIGNGLIHKTWYVNTIEGAEFILQKMNTEVFKNPADIAENMRMINEHLKTHFPHYLFIRMVDDRLYESKDGVYRMYPFIHNSHTIDTPANVKQVYEAARQFGQFTRKLSGMDASQLHDTLPGFHNLSLRYDQFLASVRNVSGERLSNSGHEICELNAQAGIVERYKKITQDPGFHLRITHHDTKINNVLFDKDDNGLCVIDLDTVMPGYFISDVGDMMRTYLSPVNEESTEFSQIVIKDEYLQAITDGYLSEMQGELSGQELASFYFSGSFMIYMQALRFLTDYLNNDVYYGAKYPEHNLNRARNQLALLRKYEEKIAEKKVPV